MQHLAFSSSIDIEYSEELSISDVKTNVWYYGIKCNNITYFLSHYYVGALNLLPTLALKSSNISLNMARCFSLWTSHQTIISLPLSF